LGYARNEGVFTGLAMPFTTYIVRCSDGTLYTGYSRDLEKRLALHNAGLGAAYTRGRRPVRLVHAESFPTQREAMQRECRLKKWSRAKKEALIAGSGPPQPTRS